MKTNGIKEHGCEQRRYAEESQELFLASSEDMFIDFTERGGVRGKRERKTSM